MPGRELVVLQSWVIEDDLDRQALHDLDVVAGGVLGRQHAECGAGAALETVDLAVEGDRRHRVDNKINVLPRAYVGQLGLLEVRRHPAVVLHQGEQRLARIDVVAGADGAMGDDTSLRRHDRAVGELQFRRLGVCRGLLQRRLCRKHLRLRRPRLRLCTANHLAVGVELRLGGVERRSCRLDLLAANRA